MKHLLTVASIAESEASGEPPQFVGSVVSRLAIHQGVSAHGAWTALNRFESVGVIHRDHRSKHGDRAFVLRSDSPGWIAIHAALQATRAPLPKSERLPTLSGYALDAQEEHLFDGALDGNTLPSWLPGIRESWDRAREEALMPRRTRTELSKRTFNSLHRLDLALHSRSLATRQGPGFVLEELVSASGIARTAVHRELKLFVEIGALHEMRIDRSVVYTCVRDDPFWAFIDGLVARTSGTASEAQRALP